MHILILGSLPENQERIDLYETMTAVAENYADTVHSPLDTVEFEGSEAERYRRALELVARADLIVGEQSKPSTGQGIEIGYAATLGKPLVVVAGKGAKVSGLVKGSPVLREVIYYTGMEDLAKKLEEFLESERL